MVSHAALRTVRASLNAVATVLAVPTAWQLVLLAAAAARRRSGEPAGAASTRAVVLVPAHDEEEVIRDTLAALARLDPPAVRVVVVADHCTDRTAEVAREAGAEVLERDGGDRGKGAALGWALERLRDDVRGLDAVVLVDADCWPTPNLIGAVGARLRAGAEAVQADYVVANPDAGPAAALRDAAFRLRNTIRPSGQDALGLSAGLLGTGMAFTPALLERHPWESRSIVEDAEQHLALVTAGVRVAFAPEAAVHSPMPATLGESADQQLRWESGGGHLVRAWAPRLAAAALRDGDRGRAGALVELLLPAQSLLLAGQAGTLGAAVVLRARAAGRLAAFGLAGQAVFVLGGMVVAGAPRSAYRALLHAPALVVQKLGLVAKVARGDVPESFVRTERASA